MGFSSGSEEEWQRHGEGSGKGNGDAGKPRRRSKNKRLLGEKQRENAEAFSQGHTDDGLDEDLA
jgi:hypothetical protein